MVAVIDRRATPRVLHEVRISFQTGHTFYTGLQCDVSTGGVFIATEDLLPRGTRVSFELTLGPQVIRVPVTGIVRWLRVDDSGGMPLGMGVQWDDLSPRLLSRIEAFVESHESLYYDDDEDA